MVADLTLPPVFRVRVEDCPCSISFGAAVSSHVGGGGGVTVTVALLTVEPPGPEHCAI